MITLLRVFSFAGACGLAMIARAADVAAPFRPLSLEAALPVASNEGKIVVIDFFTTWCEPCKRLDAETWADAGVQALLGKTAVALKLDAEKEGRAAASRYKVNAYPTVLLVKPDGTVLDRIVGFLEPKRFTAAYTLALEGKPALVRAQAVVDATAGTVDRATVQARHELARTLARDGDSAGALKEILWLYDEGMVKVPSFSAVRTSFLVSDWGRLAKDYPPAREAMIERRDAAEKRLRGPDVTRESGAEFAALCQALGEEDRLLSTFEAVRDNDRARTSLGFRLVQLLLARRHYADALSVQPYVAMSRMADLAVTAPPGADPKLIEMRRRPAITAMLDSIEVLAGAGDTAHANEMVTRLKAFDASEETARAIDERLKRARQ